jgi:phosphohistidine swiveling domain-containing protein
MTEFVINIEIIAESDIPLTGSKASNLARMMRNGINVPSGFCMNTQAYDLFIKGCPHFDSLIDEFNGISSDQIDRIHEISDKIRIQLLKTSIPNEIAKAIPEKLNSYGNCGFAVRSSATFEDSPETSFAGQHDSYLNIRGLESILEKIKQCWISLFTDRAVSYRIKNGIDHRKVKMAVIIQKMVNADVSGIAFTVNPLSGSHMQIVIEAGWGLGEGIVQGRINPDRHVISRKLVKYRYERAGDKKIRIVLDGESGVKIEELPESMSLKSCLGKRDAVRLAKISLEIENLFGTPQDIEWAISRGRIYILQSRPITALKPSPTFEEAQVWSNLNTSEILPTPVTPLTWSLIRVVEKIIFDPIYKRVGLNLGDARVVGLVGGRVYFNLNTMVGLFRAFPFFDVKGMNQMLGGEQASDEHSRNIDIADEGIPDVGFSTFKALISLPGFIGWILSGSIKNGMKLENEIRTTSESMLLKDLSNLDHLELLKEFQQDMNLLLRYTESILMQVSNIIWFGMFDKLCCKLFNDPDGEICKRLTSVLEGIDSANSGIDLWNLALEARGNVQIEEIIRSDRNFENVKNSLKLFEEGRSFLKKWDDFMQKHGHHSQTELELFSPRWSERPDFILNVVRNYMDSSDGFNLEDELKKQVEKRRELTRECRKQIHNPFTRINFDILLAKAIYGSRFRENMKSSAVMHFTALRKMLLKLGEKLVEKEILADRDDIFFVGLDEMDKLVEGREIDRFKSLIRERRAEFEKNNTYDPPPLVIGVFDPARHILPGRPEESSRNELSGLSVYPGEAEGPARVIREIESLDNVRHGEILVAPFTNPGWSLYMVNAKGIVVDTGGLMSHGAIIAREYGIPTIVNVRNASRIILTGQRVKLDASRGIVYLF